MNKVKAVYEEDLKNGFGTITQGGEGVLKVRSLADIWFRLQLWATYTRKKGGEMFNFNNSKQITINKQHRLGSHEEQPLLFSLVHLILCWPASTR